MRTDESECPVSRGMRYEVNYPKVKAALKPGLQNH